MKEQHSKHPEQAIAEGFISGIDVTKALLAPLGKPLGEIAVYTISRAVQRKLRK